MTLRTGTGDALQDSFLRRCILGPDDLLPGIEQRVLDDGIHPVPDPSTRHLLASFDPRNDMPGPRPESES